MSVARIFHPTTRRLQGAPGKNLSDNISGMHTQSPSLAAGPFRALLILFLVLAAANPSFSKSRSTLPQNYREWLNRDVAYIISKDEKATFLKLATNEDRDNFIEKFWEVRNPTPGAPTNPYKDEHYRRLEYANQYFGQFTEGWRSDRGKIYITLGPPKQRAEYNSNRNLRPMEIWFYSTNEPSLPPFFYVVFYRPEAGLDYKLYSPYMDGPDKLVTTNKVVNDRVGALKLIQDSVGGEVARTTLSLLPDEPVDLQEATSSLQSDVLLSRILNLANDPLTLRERARRKELMVNVTTRLILGGEFLDVLTTPLRDADGHVGLNYVLRLKTPEDFSLGQTKDGRYYYSVEVTARVRNPDGKLIFEQVKKLSKFLDEEEFLRFKNRIAGYEGLLPLAPGKYKIEFIFGNLLKHTAFRAEREVEVPDVPADGMRVTPIVAFSDAQPLKPGTTDGIPFSAANMKFTPMVGDELVLQPDENLKIFYQIWDPSANAASPAGQKLKVNYAFGRLGLRGDAKVISEDVDMRQFDAGGSLINGKKISLADLPFGNYVLSVSLSDAGTHQTANATLGFRISSVPASEPPWDIVDENVAADIRSGLVDYWRGLCYLAEGKNGEAIESFLAALKKNPAADEARSHLADIYFSEKDFAGVAALYPPGEINGKTDERTILNVAESLDKLGQTKKAISLLEAALDSRSESGALFLALASYYQRLGDTQKAEQLERKGKSLMDKVTPAS
jgi:GWxTD domain-containing protein